ncbi:MAG: ATP-binding protein [Lacibacter sp.]|jgi:NadR type nicotinamide-nucleotide adenylyltransferase|nr:ATP-binding protein [Lacibacter sp.]
MNFPKKVVLLGPESTGKSFLCERLASHYQSVWCPEYAREYLLMLGRAYTAADLLVIAKNQTELAEQYTADAVSKKANTIFFDTDMHVMKVWSEVVFGTCDPLILQELKQQQYDLYLLCKPDIPWVEDELREYPEQKVRNDLFEIYKELLQKQTTPWSIISGNFDERFTKAIKAVDALLN